MSYTVDFDGLVILNNRLLSLRSEDLLLFQKHVIAPWTTLLARASRKYAIPVSWLMGIVWAESQGNPNALRVESSGATGVGLMQITDASLKGKLSDEEVADPTTNIEIGTRFLSSLRARDLPSLASQYNCGSSSSGGPKFRDNEWGLCASPGYLEHVSSASNNYAMATGELVQTSGPVSASFLRTLGTLALVTVGSSLIFRSLRR